MPRYLFNVDDGERLTRDGIVLPCPNHAERGARTLLENLAVLEVANGRDRLFAAKVQDERDRTTYQGSVALVIDQR